MDDCERHSDVIEKKVTGRGLVVGTQYGVNGRMSVVLSTF